MPNKITRDVLESYLSCRYKAHLKMRGKVGVQSDYGRLLASSRREATTNAIEKILAR